MTPDPAPQTKTVAPFRPKPPAAVAAVGVAEDATLEFAAESSASAARRFPLARVGLPVLGGLLVIAAIAASVWVLVRAMPGTVAMGSLRVESDPQGAEVRINGTLRGTTPVSLSLPPGTYTLAVQQGGNVRRMPVEVSGSEGSAYHITWTQTTAAAAPTGSLSVGNDAAGSLVTVDGIDRGRAPLTVPGLSVGRHEVIVRSASATYRRSVDVEANATAALVISGPAAPAPWGWITIAAPFRMQVLEAGRVVGSSDIDRIMLPPGEHELELVAEQYGFRQTTSVRVAAGRGGPLELSIPRVAMNINALPWAEVFIDGVRVGDTPLANVLQPIGDHEIVFRHPQLGEKRQVARVTTRDGSRVSVDMRAR